MKRMAASLSKDYNWRHVALVFLVLSSLVWVFSLNPIPQDIAYHNFADTRRFLGIPNFFDVVSNLAFLLVGAFGSYFCLKNDLGATRKAWLALFAGIGLVGLGSAYYHWRPGNDTLVWDRLPMSFGFMGFFTALLGEYVDSRLCRLLILLIILGMGSVLYWYRFDDLRPYAWVQFVPLLTIPFVMAMFRSRYTHQWLLIVVLVWYLLAKGAEVYDVAIFRITGEVVSGHTIKHLLAAAGCYSILLMLQKRKLRK